MIHGQRCHLCGWHRQVNEKAEGFCSNGLGMSTLAPDLHLYRRHLFPPEIIAVTKDEELPLNIVIRLAGEGTA